MLWLLRMAEDAEDGNILCGVVRDYSVLVMAMQERPVFDQPYLALVACPISLTAEHLRDSRPVVGVTSDRCCFVCVARLGSEQSRKLGKEILQRELVPDLVLFSITLSIILLPI